MTLLAGGFGQGYSGGNSDNHFGVSVRWDYQRYPRDNDLTVQPW